MDKVLTQLYGFSKLDKNSINSRGLIPFKIFLKNRKEKIIADFYSAKNSKESKKYIH